MKSLLLLSVLSLSSVSAFAGVTCKQLEASGKISSTDTCKVARANDVADVYVLDRNGTFSRFVRGSKCTITTEVKSFKVSQHPNDVAMTYFEQKGNLVILKNPTGEELSKSCPKAVRTNLMANVAKYNVVSNTETTIVNTALDAYGNFTAWDNKNVVASYSGVADYKMNQCFGSKGKSFNSYVAFLIGSNGTVLKLKGLKPSESKFESQSYYSIDSFEQKNQVCKEMNE